MHFLSSFANMPHREQSGEKNAQGMLRHSWQRTMCTRQVRFHRRRTASQEEDLSNILVHVLLSFANRVVNFLAVYSQRRRLLHKTGRASVLDGDRRQNASARVETLSQPHLARFPGGTLERKGSAKEICKPCTSKRPMLQVLIVPAEPGQAGVSTQLS